MREIIKRKKADNLSILTETDIRLNMELKEKDMVREKHKAKEEKIIPPIDPAIAKRLPHKLDNLSFFWKRSEPTAPIAKKDNNKRKPMEDVM